MPEIKSLFDIEITTRCNKQCYCCPRENFKRMNRDMSLETFEKICDWLPIGCDVYFAGYGEPLLHKELMFFIERLSQKGIRSSIMTNGKLLSCEKIRELYEAGLYKLQISILLKNEEKEVEKFVDMIDCKFYSQTQFNLLYDEDVKENESLYNSLKTKGFKVLNKNIHSRSGQLYKSDVKNMNNSECGTFSRITYIDTNGSLQICSNDINGEHNLGNIETITFEELMEKKRNIKEIIASICKQCDDEYRQRNLQKLEAAK